MQEERSNSFPAEIRARLSPEIVARIDRASQGREAAIVVGNRAGVIQWANPNWSSVTGYALDHYVSKPVVDFLRHVDVEPDVVAVVARCFRQRKPCKVEIPLTTPRGELIVIELRVEPLLDASGEVSEFIALASDISEQLQTASEIAEIDLSLLALGCAKAHREVLHENTSYDLALADDMPLVLANSALLEELVERLIYRAAGSIGDGWGTLSISTGVLGTDEPPLYQGNIWQGLPHGQFAYLEVHDTGTVPSGFHHQIVEEPFSSNHHPGSPMPLSTVRERLASQGGELRLQSISWSGTSLVMLLPYAIEHGLEGS